MRARPWASGGGRRVPGSLLSPTAMLRGGQQPPGSLPAQPLVLEGSHHEGLLSCHGGSCHQGQALPSPEVAVCRGRMELAPFQTATLRAEVNGALTRSQRTAPGSSPSLVLSSRVWSRCSRGHVSEVLSW